MITPWLLLGAEFTSSFSLQDPSKRRVFLSSSVFLTLLALQVQITDAGAQMLLESLTMDRSLMLLDLSTNQLTAKRYRP